MSNIDLTDIELRFHPKEKSFPYTIDYTKPDGYPDRVPIYYNYDAPYMYYGVKYLSITYFIFYKDNKAIGLGGLFPKVKSLGYHDRDRELIKILYSVETLKPEHVFFSAHAQEGRFYKYSECRFNNNKLIVYSSLNSHSCRKDPGTYIRVLGLANDKCSDDGKKITPYRIECNVTYNAQNREVFSKPLASAFLPFFQPRVEFLKEKQRKEEEKNNKK
jgi:hypothetical protein